MSSPISASFSMGSSDLKRTPSSPPEYSQSSSSRVPNAQTSYYSGSSDLEAVIPESHDNRTLVLCFDGTGDQFDDDNSNVVNLFSMLKKDDPSQQLVYYQAGIGTYNIPQIARPFMAKLNRVVDSMIGIHLNAHVMGGYEFLMQNYESGDKICIFGFSRGAYTARALAGMVHKVGLLPRYNHNQVPFAYKMYSREDETGWKQSTAFKKAFSIDVDIEFLGVWDTVGSVGIIPRRLPFTISNSSVKHFRHALALDEHRARFMPNFWHRALPEQHKHGVQRGTMPKSGTRGRKSQHLHGPSRSVSSTTKSLRELEREYDESLEEISASPTDVEEVWFAGCHCDVGGGAVKNETRNCLARIPLRWMIRECFKLKTGILFHREMLPLAGLDPSTLCPEVKPRPASVTSLPHHGREATTDSSVTHRSTFLEDFVNEEEEDLKDALSPVNDMLKQAKAWWILEVFPYKIKYQNNHDAWVQKVAWANLGRARHIPKKHSVKVHRSVKIRMEAQDLAEGKYAPRPKWNFEPIWVD